MDLTGRKQRALENVIKAQAATIKKLEASELALMGQIREMDQLIFQMSQCDSWARMQPLFDELLCDTRQRMTKESQRIQTALLPEMQKAYR